MKDPKVIPFPHEESRKRNSGIRDVAHINNVTQLKPRQESKKKESSYQILVDSIRNIVGDDNALVPATPPPSGSFVSIKKINNGSLHNIPHDDHLHHNIQKLDAMLAVLSQEVGVKNVESISSVILEILSETYEYGKFTKTIETLDW